MELPNIEEGETSGGRPGFVYLIHFSEPISHAQHYLGFATDLERRLKEHERGCDKAKLIAEAMRRGIKLTVVRIWKGDGNFERKLKKRKNGRKLCPCCNPALK